MFFGKIISTAVLGLTALAGLSNASLVRAHNRVIIPRAAPRTVPRATVNTTDAALAIATGFQTKVYTILPKLVDYDTAGQDTTPVFNALFKSYDEVTKAILNLPPYQSPSDIPSSTEQKLIDVSNETLNSVNAVINVLNTNDINSAHAKTLKVKTDDVARAFDLTIRIGRIRIIIIIIGIRRVG